MLIDTSNRLTVSWDESELEGLQTLLLRALNCWDPQNVPKWAWQLDAAVVAKLNDVKAQNGN